MQVLSICRKQNNTRDLVRKTLYMSCLTSCRRAEDLSMFGNHKISAKSQNSVETESSVQSPLQKWRQSSLLLSMFAWFFYTITCRHKYFLKLRQSPSKFNIVTFAMTSKSSRSLYKKNKTPNCIKFSNLKVLSKHCLAYSI